MRSIRSNQALPTWILFAILCPVLYSGDGAAGAKPADGALMDADRERFATRFEAELWPLFLAGGEKKNCLSCHADEGVTPLLLFRDARGTFRALLSGGYLEPDNPVGLLGRLGSPDPKVRMPPPPAAALGEKEFAPVRAFVGEVFSLKAAGRDEMARRFPEALLEPWKGPRPAPGDNAFLSYTQLRGKIAVIFGDAWLRGEKDLFQENLAQFGGADFRRSFNESSKASATFLSALDRLSEDVASRAHLERTGPFAGFDGSLPRVAAESDDPSPEEAEAIRRLHRSLLFRDPTPEELRRSHEFLRGVERDGARLAEGASELAFELTVTGEEGASTTRAVSIPVESDPRALHLEWLENDGAEAVPEGKLLRRRIGERFRFVPGDPGQAFFLLNRETQGQVTFHALEVTGPFPAEPPIVTPGATAGGTPAAAAPATTKIIAGDRSIQAFGSWSLGEREGAKFYSDGDENKGDSVLRVPIAVKEEGLYELRVSWLAPETRSNQGKPADEKGDGKRKRAARTGGARARSVEVLSHNEASRLGLPPALPAPPPGEAVFLLDQTVDDIAFQDLRTSFRFGPDDAVEVRNGDTTQRVVADAVKFEPVIPEALRGAAAPIAFLIDNDEAEGREAWKVFNPGAFKPYNITGKDTVTDDNQRKGELSLRYRPASKKGIHREDLYYRVSIGFPGKRGNETQAPVAVRARASSPIVPLRAPHRARVGAEVTLDASGSYDLQRSQLAFRWSQRGGPRVEVSDPRAPRLVFRAPARLAAEEGWTGLCRALLKHPDFLFTRPVSLERTIDPRERARLLLVKIAADLVARAPTQDELERLEKGGSLEEAIDRYLESEEFRRFYLHRVRLYLESDGTAEGDEPVRLWCFVAFAGRSFQEILAGDYTVVPAEGGCGLATAPRPARHGRTGLLTMAGFVKGRPGLPHYNYAAHVAEKFLGYVFEVPPEIVAMREAITAIATTSPGSVCYSCHQVLTPLAHQRLRWGDDGSYREKDEKGAAIDDTDRGLVPTYLFRGQGMEAFAAKAKETERFIRTMINTHFVWYFGREMRYEADERGMYKRLWDKTRESGFKIRALIRAILTSREYLGS